MFVTALFCACHSHSYNPNKNLSLSDYADMRVEDYVISPAKVRAEISRQMHIDHDSLTADYRARSYYLNSGPWLWITRAGVDHRADTLLKYIKEVKELGFAPSQFRVEQIENDLKRLRALDFDTAANRISSILGRLEYNLTKAYLRYSTGQRFGYINPKYIFNRLDVLDSDSVHVSYRGLYDIPMQQPRSSFFQEALSKIRNDSLAEFLKAIQPSDSLYFRLLERLNSPSTPPSEKPKIMVNMERLRWRLNDYPRQHSKYVVVNIPAYRLRAVNGDSVLEMRVGVGALSTKTPLLTSRIKRMDINPQWIIPRSIIDKSIIHHAGDSSYFARHRYFARDRRTGLTVRPERISRAVLEDKNFLVIQEGGEGNSLGRIIFRFDNAFSIYLHDTSSKSVFARDNRGVSHGCVRVERPFELAVFLLKDKDKSLISKIGYSMQADVSSLGAGRDRAKEAPDTLNRSLIIGSVKVEPTVPVFITYFTLWPEADGRMVSLPDVYGYDSVIYKHLENYR